MPWTFKSIKRTLVLSLSGLFLLTAPVACVRQESKVALATGTRPADSRPAKLGASFKTPSPNVETYLDVERPTNYVPVSGPISQARDTSKIYGDAELDMAYENWLARGKPSDPDARKYDLKGQASWYGPGLNGNKTASGKVFDMYALTAAHKKLPFGTIVKVKNNDTGKAVVVRITDRGPFTKGRIIDLSFGAAHLVGMVRSGVAPVVVEIIQKP